MNLSFWILEDIYSIVVYACGYNDYRIIIFIVKIFSNISYYIA